MSTVIPASHRSEPMHSVSLDESTQIIVHREDAAEVERVSRVTIEYIADLLTDVLMHDGEVRYPVSLRLAPGVQSELAQVEDLLSRLLNRTSR